VADWLMSLLPVLFVAAGRRGALLASWVGREKGEIKG
jgi:hypothetical protein